MGKPCCPTLKLDAVMEHYRSSKSKAPGWFESALAHSKLIIQDKDRKEASCQERVLWTKSFIT
jgi:hypothetical protein